MRSARPQLGQRADPHLRGPATNCSTLHGGVGWALVLLLTVGAIGDQLLPGQVFIQLQPGIDIPRHIEYGPRTAYLRTAVGRSFAGDGELGRLWSPMLEVIGNRDLTPGTKTDWDVVPEFQVTLNRRQHIRAAAGAACRSTIQHRRRALVSAHWVSLGKQPETLQC